MNLVVVGVLVGGIVFNRRWVHVAIAVFLVLMVLGAMLIE